ncbi:hypothetical protein M9194_04380 [Vibrio sp. S4M6]|uniref:SPOR domain-containing protein n=1 Tax=Vibrio sinus TaxID=2946865 RepID=UPI00202A865C|nr:SPOR domain-containing protein [Vibrio sinus]MCL9780673.1 hypothetical protein [Vibrio sinus]
MKARLSKRNTALISACCLLVFSVVLIGVSLTNMSAGAKTHYETLLLHLHVVSNKPTVNSKVTVKNTEHSNFALKGTKITSVAAHLESKVKPTLIDSSTEKLKSYSLDSYTVQLAALPTLDKVTQFIQRYSLANKVLVYRGWADHHLRYIVTYGNYSTFQQANSARALMEQQLKHVKPWVKPASWVMKELQGKPKSSDAATSKVEPLPSVPKSKDMPVAQVHYHSGSYIEN